MKVSDATFPQILTFRSRHLLASFGSGFSMVWTLWVEETQVGNHQYFFTSREVKELNKGKLSQNGRKLKKNGFSEESKENFWAFGRCITKRRMNAPSRGMCMRWFEHD